MNRPDHCIHVDPHLASAMAMELEIVRTHPTDDRWRMIGAAVDGEWVHEIEGTRLRISSAMASTAVSVSRLSSFSTESVIEFPWNRNEPLPHPGAIVERLAAVLVTGGKAFGEDAATAWAIGAAALLDEEQASLGTGRRVRCVTLPGPAGSGQEFRALLDDMKLAETPLVTTIGAIAPTTLMVMGDAQMLWIQPASITTDPGDDHDPAADPVGTLRAAAMVREALAAAKGRP